MQLVITENFLKTLFETPRSLIPSFSVKSAQIPSYTMGQGSSACSEFRPHRMSYIVRFGSV